MLIKVLAFHARFPNVEVRILDSLLVKVLLLLEVGDLNQLLLNYISRLLVLSYHVLLIAL